MCHTIGPCWLSILIIVVCVHTQSRPTLWKPMDCSPQIPLSMGLSRQDHCSGLPFPTPAVCTCTQSYLWCLSTVLAIPYWTAALHSYKMINECCWKPLRYGSMLWGNRSLTQWLTRSAFSSVEASATLILMLVDFSIITAFKTWLLSVLCCCLIACLFLLPRNKKQCIMVEWEVRVMMFHIRTVSVLLLFVNSFKSGSLSGSPFHHQDIKKRFHPNLLSDFHISIKVLWFYKIFMKLLEYTELPSSSFEKYSKHLRHFLTH